jgi:hypothetical protein
MNADESGGSKLLLVFHHHHLPHSIPKHTIMIFKVTVS